MKNVIIAVLAFALFISSCQSQEKEMTKENSSPSLQPKPLSDKWSKWLVGEWEGSAESDVGAGKVWTKIDFGLNGQFLIMKSESEITEITDSQRQYLKDTLRASDEDIERSRSSTFKELQIHTIDPKTGERIGYLFDSLRCIAKGIGKREANKEIVEWKWSGSGQGASIRITEKVSDDKFIATEKYTMPGGSIMEDKREMTRKK